MFHPVSGHRLAAAVLCAVVALPLLVHGAESKPAGKQAVESVPDPVLSLAVCRAETQRNAKLYALRAHGIVLMRASSRSQGRSSQSLEEQLEKLGAGLTGQPSALREVERAQEAVTTLTELTVQEPLVGQIAGAERLADQAGEACERLGRELNVVQGDTVQRVAEMWWLSQRLARRYLAAPLNARYVAAERALVIADARTFESLLEWLRGRAAQDGSLAHPVQLIQGQWVFQRVALERARADKAALEYVGRVSESLHEILWIEVQRRMTHSRQN